MMKYIVRLTEEEREFLTELARKGKTQAYRIKHANILLKADADGPNWADEKIAEAFGCHRNTVHNVRKRLVEQGLEVAEVVDRQLLGTPKTEFCFPKAKIGWRNRSPSDSHWL